MKVLLEYVAALPHTIYQIPPLSLLLNLLMPAHTPLSLVQCFMLFFSEVKSYHSSRFLWETNCCWKVCNFYTSCNSSDEIFHMVGEYLQGYLVVSLFSMIDLKENFLSSARKEDHLADLLLWLTTPEVSLKDLFRHDM